MVTYLVPNELIDSLQLGAIRDLIGLKPLKPTNFCEAIRIDPAPPSSKQKCLPGGAPQNSPSLRSFLRHEITPKKTMTLHLRFL